ncbi:hypothetical protein O3M35_011931 [Rhynocoris fuscipes]|uniref:Uncharacterized protein n=1 Tax=Rhynocoris fuscipes TaxID=488301 RepID=A0AAW1D0M7_9HEMI
MSSTQIVPTYKFQLNPVIRAATLLETFHDFVFQFFSELHIFLNLSINFINLGIKNMIILRFFMNQCCQHKLFNFYFFCNLCHFQHHVGIILTISINHCCLYISTPHYIL